VWLSIANHFSEAKIRGEKYFKNQKKTLVNKAKRREYSSFVPPRQGGKS